jgi:hypothetical protein
MQPRLCCSKECRAAFVTLNAEAPLIEHERKEHERKEHERKVPSIESIKITDSTFHAFFTAYEPESQDTTDEKRSGTLFVQLRLHRVSDRQTKHF